MDLLLRHAWLIDGSGDAGRAAEVAVTGDRISAIGRPGQFAPGRRTQVVDLDGLALAPGFIDIHTHYDAQILWDGDLTPSCWHGVTSVIMGNCGFGIAPARPEHREILVRTLENVEGMSMEALEADIDWCFESFPQYLSALERRGKRLNVGALVGHTPLRDRTAISLEDAVWRLTGHPARAFRIAGRGLVREGYCADLVAFDPATVGTTPVERVHDQPGGADRLVMHSTGVEHMWVNGVAVRRAGQDIPGAAAGRVLRG